MQNDYAEILAYGHKTLVTTPYMSAITAASTVDLTAISSASDHPIIEVRQFQSLSVHARISENPGSVQFSVVRYTKDENGVYQLQEVDDPYTIEATVFTDGASKHLSYPLDFSVKGADIIKLVTVVVSAAEVDLWARKY